MSLTQPLASTSKTLLPSPTSLHSSLQSLHLLRSQIFQTSHNPQSLRTGANYLKKRLRGPAMVRYVTPSIYVDLERERWEAAWRGKPLLKKDPHKDKPTKIKEKGGKINLPEGGIVGSKVFSESMGAVAGPSTSSSAIKPTEFRLMRTKQILRNPAFHPSTLPSPLHPSTLPGGIPFDRSTPESLKDSQSLLRDALKSYYASASAQTNNLVAEGFELVPPGVPGAHLGVAGGKSGRVGGGGPGGEKVEEAWEWLSDERERGRREEVRLRRAEGRGPPKKGQGRRSQMKRK